MTKCIVYLEANSLWDSLDPKRLRVGNHRLNVQQFLAFLQLHGPRVSVRVPAFAVLEYAHKQRDSAFCERLISTGTLSFSDLARYRSHYLSPKADDENALLITSLCPDIDADLLGKPSFLNLEKRFPEQLPLVAQRILERTPLSIFDALQLASALLGGANAFVSADSIFSQPIVNSSIRRAVDVCKRQALIPNDASFPVFVNQRNDDATVEIKKLICTNEQQRMKERFMGQVNKMIVNRSNREQLLYYRHCSEHLRVEEGRRIAVVGVRTYSRLLKVRQVHDDAGQIHRYVCTSSSHQRNLSLSFEDDSDQHIDSPIARPDDKVYLET